MKFTKDDEILIIFYFLSINFYSGINHHQPKKRKSYNNDSNTDISGFRLIIVQNIFNYFEKS